MNIDGLTLDDAVIIIPSLDEEAAIAGVIAEIREQHSVPIIVVDDNSQDMTVAYAEKAGATVLPLVSRLGAWGATQAGLRYALRQGYKIAITMDADGQHPADSISALIAPVRQGKADVVIGSCTRRGSRLRKIAWMLMKKTSGLSLEDLTSGFRVYNRRAIQELAHRRATLLDYQDVGVLLLLQSRGIRISDVEVRMQARQSGKSRVFHSWLVVIYYMCHTLILGLSKRQRANGYSDGELRPTR